MIIAVDFDGTIVEHKYPAIGKEIPNAIATLKKLKAEKHKLILWSMRQGKLLDDALDFCRQRGLEFYAANSDYPDEGPASDQTTSCRKVYADVYIDDRNVGGIPDWNEIYEMIHNRWTYSQLWEARSRQAEGRHVRLSLKQRLTGRM